MRDILRQSNLDLLRGIDRLRSVLSTSPIPDELAGYYQWIWHYSHLLRHQALQHLHDLDLNRDKILVDILSSTQETTRRFHWYDQFLVSPVLRALPTDRLCLRILGWLHKIHPETQDIPAGLHDGEFGVWPKLQFPAVYFMPSSRQYSLLYLPLFFHEFGHLLYTCHEPEMDDLVRGLQEKISALLEPLSGRDDHYAQMEAQRRAIIVETWYKWTQEFFCDAVGFTIGGPCFARAFSMYLHLLGRGEFHLPENELAFRDHPVTWLRIRSLADRARQMGWSAEAETLENEWDKIAATMGVTEDYYGFYVDEFLPSIRGTLNDMLEEASPQRFTDDDVSPSEWDPESSSPVHLLNRAWSVFLKDPDSYADWEEQVISAFLANNNNEQSF